MRKLYPKRKPKKIKWEGDRIVGCQSANHSVCKGDLWECERCHKVVCWEEGSTYLVEVCDDCWYEIQDLGHAYHMDLGDWRKKDYGLWKFGPN